MPLHDWTRVSDGVFHNFHYSWVLEIKRALMRGLLPPGYYVMAEQFGGDVGAPDVLTLQAKEAEAVPTGPLPGTATLAESPPAVAVRTRISRSHYARKQRTLVIRHVSGDRIVALIEVISPGNKSSRHAIRSLLAKMVAALDGGVHLLFVDVHPPGPRDPQGLHAALLSEITNDTYALPEDRRLTVASYVGGAGVVEAFVAHFAVGQAIPEMPLFLTNEHYLRVPLESTYLAAWEDLPAQHQATLSRPVANG